MLYEEDTIAAVSSGQGDSAIAVVRISGGRSKSILSSIFATTKPKKESGMLSLGWIINPNTKEKIDQAMAAFFSSPATFTGEDMAEIYCHGGRLIVQNILMVILERGARLAEKGEFSKRAFLNGKIDLIQAEAIVEAIRAKTNYGLKSAMHRLDGKLSKEIFGISKGLEDILVEIEASTDFPDDVETPNSDRILEALSRLFFDAEKFLKNSVSGKILNDGIRVSIIGKPNVGKSSIVNAILKEERSIVTDIPGTTTDTIESAANINGLPFLLNDTAGMRTPKNTIETEGVKRTEKKLGDSDIILVVFDSSEPLSWDDKKVLEKVANIENKILILNKSDKPQAIGHKDIGGDFPCLIKVSALTGEGIKGLEEAMSSIAKETFGPSHEDHMLGNSRQYANMGRAKDSIGAAISGIKGKYPIDVISIDIKEALSAISELSGANISEMILDKVFESFCIGK